VLFPLVATSALVPSFLLVWYFRARDANPEPARVLWITFFLGVFTVLPVLFVALPTVAVMRQVGDPIMRGGMEAFLSAALPEELFKFLVVTLYCARHREFDEPMDGIVYGAVASLGFATLENVLYVAQGGLSVAIMRGLSAVPAHAFMGALMGYFVGQWRFGPLELRGRNLLYAYLVPVLVHALYDAPLLALRNAGGEHAPMLLKLSILFSIAVLIVAWRIVVGLVTRLRSDQLAALALGPQSVAPAAPLVPPAVQAPSAMAPGIPLGQAQPSVPPPARPAAHTVAVLLIVFGSILASIGGLISFGVLVEILTSDTRNDLAELAVGATVIGVLPLVIGLLLFRAGLRRLGTAPTK
jgi:RsiW-degrading membrane proteinase PrsW (M82 family)